MNSHKTLWLVLCFFLASQSISHADGVDLVPYLTRVGPHDSVIIIIGLVVLLMGINYVLNFIFIGFPAMKLGGIAISRMLWDMVYITLLGQIADRIGAVLAGFGAGITAELLHLQGEASGVLSLVILNFLCSGASIAILAFYFSRRRWLLPTGKAIWVTLSAALFTNPVYLIFAGWRF